MLLCTILFPEIKESPGFLDVFFSGSSKSIVVNEIVRLKCNGGKKLLKKREKRGKICLELFKKRGRMVIIFLCIEKIQLS